MKSTKLIKDKFTRFTNIVKKARGLRKELGLEKLICNVPHSLTFD